MNSSYLDQLTDVERYNVDGAQDTNSNRHRVTEEVMIYLVNTKALSDKCFEAAVKHIEGLAVANPTLLQIRMARSVQRIMDSYDARKLGNITTEMAYRADAWVIAGEWINKGAEMLHYNREGK